MQVRHTQHISIRMFSVLSVAIVMKLGIIEVERLILVMRIKPGFFSLLVLYVSLTWCELKP